MRALEAVPSSPKVRIMEDLGRCKTFNDQIRCLAALSKSLAMAKVPGTTKDALFSALFLIFRVVRRPGQTWGLTRPLTAVLEVLGDEKRVDASFGPFLEAIMSKSIDKRPHVAALEAVLKVPCARGAISRYRVRILGWFASEIRRCLISKGKADQRLFDTLDVASRCTGTLLPQAVSAEMPQPSDPEFESSAEQFVKAAAAVLTDPGVLRDHMTPAAMCVVAGTCCAGRDAKAARVAVGLMVSARGSPWSGITPMARITLTQAVLGKIPEKLMDVDVLGPALGTLRISAFGVDNAMSHAAAKGLQTWLSRASRLLRSDASAVPRVRVWASDLMNLIEIKGWKGWGSISSLCARHVKAIYGPCLDLVMQSQDPQFESDTRQKRQTQAIGLLRKLLASAKSTCDPSKMLPPSTHSTGWRSLALVERCGGLVATRECPGLLPWLLSAASSIKGWKSSSLAIQGILRLAWTETADKKDKSKNKKAVRLERVRSVWVSPLARALVCAPKGLRNDMAAEIFGYILKKIDREALGQLLAAVRAEGRKIKSGSNYSAAVVQTTLALAGVARSGGIPVPIAPRGITAEKLFSDEGDAKVGGGAVGVAAVPYAWVRMSVLGYDGPTRRDAIQLLCSGRSTKKAPPVPELACLRDVLPFLLKLENSAFEQQLVHRVRSLVERLAACADAAGEDGARCRNFILWFEGLLFENVYPGAPFSRISASLELYHNLARIASESRPKDLLDIMSSTSRLSTLVSWLNSEFDQAQSCAYDTLRLIVNAAWASCQSPLSTLQDAQHLLTWAGGLLHSPRTRQAEAGALIFRLCVDRFLRGPRPLRISVSSTKRAGEIFSAETGDWKDGGPLPVSFAAAMNWRNGVVSALRSRAFDVENTRLEMRFEGGVKAPAAGVYGLIVVLRYALTQPAMRRLWATTGRKNYPDEKNNSVELAAVSTWACKAMEALLAFGGVCLELHERSEYDDSRARLEQPALPKKSLAKNSESKKSRPGVDCRGHVTIVGGDMSAEEREGASQRASVGSWLGIKETALCLADAAHALPISAEKINPKTDKKSAGVRAGTLPLSLVARAGEWLFRGLLRSVHNGVHEILSEGLNKISAALLALPGGEGERVCKGWVDSILISMEGKGEQMRYFRRSNGAALCLSAILEAETKIRRRTPLLCAALDRIIALVSRAEADWPVTVNAINLTRPFFRNAKLSVTAETRTGPALTGILRHFRHAKWAVRNAALVAFAAIAPRAVRGAGAANTRRDTANTFLQKFPQLADRLLEILQEAIRPGRSADKVPLGAEKLSTGESASRRNLHPQLFPALQILSKLSGGEQPSDPSLSARFLPLLRQCAGSRFFMARHMAAEALAALVPAATRADFLKTIIRSLPSGPSGAVDHNSVHGLLMQIGSVAACGPPSAAIVALNGLGERTWLCRSDAMRCDVVRARFLAATLQCLHAAAKKSDNFSAPEWVLCAAVRVLDDENGVALGGAPSNMPAARSVRPAAARLALAAATTATSRAGELLIFSRLFECLLQDADADTRCAAASAIIDRADLEIFSAPNVSDRILTGLLARLGADKMAPDAREVGVCVRACDRVLSGIPGINRIPVFTPRTGEVLLAVSRRSGAPAVAAAALRVLAHAIHQSNGEKKAVILRDFYIAVEKASFPDQPVPVRRAAATALGLVGCWNPKKSSFSASFSAKCIAALVRLLQDEEDAVRAEACATAAALPIPKTINVSGGTVEGTGHHAVVSSVALRRTFAWWSSRDKLKMSTDEARVLVDMLLEPIETTALTAFDAKQAEKLFFKERDNVRKEPVLQSALAAGVVRVLSCGSSGAPPALAAQRRRILAATARACVWLRGQMNPLPNEKKYFLRQQAVPGSALCRGDVQGVARGVLLAHEAAHALAPMEMRRVGPSNGGDVIADGVISKGMPGAVHCGKLWDVIMDLTNEGGGSGVCLLRPAEGTPA